MEFEFRVFAVPFIISAIISLAVALVVLQRQNAKGGTALVLLMLEFALWAGAGAMRWSLVDPAAQVFWIKLSHAFLVPAPLTFFVFVVQLTDTDRWLTQGRLLLMASEPAATILLIATNDFHNLFYSYLRPATLNGFPEMSWGRGPWFWVNGACSYVFILAAAGILLRSILHSGPFVRIQLATVLVSCLLPWGVNAYALLSPAAARQLEVTPLAASAAGIIFAYALFRQRLLDIVPVARSLLFEKLGDGVLVLDTAGRLLDANSVAQRVLQLGDEGYGRHIWRVVPQWRDFDYVLQSESRELHMEVQGRRDPTRFYDVSLIALQDNGGRHSGYLVSLRDITEHKQAENELHRMNVRLKRQVAKISSLHDALREQAIRDPLTDLYNRRYLDETLTREFSRARRGDYPISLIMLDVDEFKTVNDTYGHKAGDRVLRSLGEIIRQHIRSGDIPCRYGGEEFVIVLPETALEVAAQRAEQIRQRFQTYPFFKGKQPVVPTLSLGVATYPAHGRSAAKLLHAADLAMYVAKSHGGNMAVRYDTHKRMMVPQGSKTKPRQ